MAGIYHLPQGPHTKRGDAIFILAGLAVLFLCTAIVWIPAPKHDIPEHISQEEPMLRPFAITIALPGTITADATFFVEAPCDLSIRAISAVANNASTGKVNVGTAADPDGYLDNKDLGDSDNPTIFDLDDFNGALVTNQGDDYPHVTAGTAIAINLDVDGSTDPIDPTIVVWCQEG